MKQTKVINLFDNEDFLMNLLAGAYDEKIKKGKMKLKYYETQKNHIIKILQFCINQVENAYNLANKINNNKSNTIINLFLFFMYIYPFVLVFH